MARAAVAGFEQARMWLEVTVSSCSDAYVRTAHLQPALDATLTTALALALVFIAFALSPGPALFSTPTPPILRLNLQFHPTLGFYLVLPAPGRTFGALPAAQRVAAACRPHRPCAELAPRAQSVWCALCPRHLSGALAALSESAATRYAVCDVRHARRCRAIACRRSTRRRGLLARC